MKIRHFLSAVAVLAVFSVAAGADQSADISSAELAMASRIESVVKDIGGVSRAWVWVKIEPDLERWSEFMKTLYPAGKKNGNLSSAAAIPRSMELLPGVTPDEITGALQRKEAAMARPASSRGKSSDLENAVLMASWFQRLSVHVAVPSNIAPERLAELRSKLPILIGLRPTRGDDLLVETIPTTGEEAAPAPKGALEKTRVWLSQMSPNTAALWLFLFVLALFMFGPIRNFLRDAATALQVIRVQAQTTGNQQNQSQIKQELETKAEALGAPDGRHGLPERPRAALGPGTPEEPEIVDLFAFVTEDILPNLLQICRQETPDHIAILVSYLKPALAGRIISSLPTVQRQDVLAQLTQERRFEPQVVKDFANWLQDTIHFVSGGPERLLELLEHMDAATKNTVLLELDRLFPETAQAVRGKMLTFVDLFRIPSKDLQKLLWEAYRARINLSVLIVALNEKGRQYMIKQLPESIAAVIVEEVAKIRQAPFELVDAEEGRLVQLARAMAKNGEIAPLARKEKTGEAA